MEVVPPISYIVAVDIKNTDASAEWIGSPRKDLDGAGEVSTNRKVICGRSLQPQHRD